MKQLLLCALLLAPLAVVSAQSQAEDADKAVADAPAAMKSITAKDLEAHLSTLASDAYGGRLTGTEGQHKTAEYIAKHFKKCGLEPLGEEKNGKPGWLQHYALRKGELDDKSGLRAPGGRRLVKGGIWLGAPKKEKRWKGPLTFLGRSARGSASDSLEGVLPVVALAVPKQKRKGMGHMFAAFRQIRSLGRQLDRRKAEVGIVLVPEFDGALLNAFNMLAVYPGKPLIQKPGAFDAMSMMGRSKVPILIIGGEDAKRVGEAMGLSWESLTSQDAEPQVAKGKGKGVWSCRVKVDWSEVQASNVVGVLRGRDPELADEALVYSAHMDHVGMGADGAAYNGADDNGSGTSTLLEMAEAYAKLPKDQRPRRSVIFLSVSGEELGLWGSEHYSDHPTWPLKKLIADINIDMIGRSTSKVPSTAISVTPTYRHRKYSTLAREAALLGTSKAFDLKMENGDRFYQRSDHYNFARKGVPVVFFCDDEHEDYHQQSDDVEKIEFSKVERIARLAFLLGYRTMNRDGRPEVLGKSDDWFEN